MPLPPPFTLSVPPNFIWGVSSSAYQIEGATTEDGRTPCIWDTHAAKPGCVTDGSTAAVAADHYHRVEDDVALIAGLGVKAYRFSTSWSRLLPDGVGPINPKGLAFYDRLIDGLLAVGVTPWLCLYHWDLPQALEERGGWSNRDIVQWFADYATVVAERFGDRVRHFATVNEPNVATLFGYAMGWAAPAAYSPARYYPAVHHLNLAHGAAVQILRDRIQKVQIGAIHNIQPIHPASDSPQDRCAAETLDAHWNGIFADAQYLGQYPDILRPHLEPFIRGDDLKAMAPKLDWFGLNHYGPIWTKAPATDAAQFERELGFVWADSPNRRPPPLLGWSIFPEAFYDTLMHVSSRYGQPVYVTENGCGNPSGRSDHPNHFGRVNDRHRILYLSRYLRQMEKALQDGADIRGYFVWSLLDAFEWGSGLSNRFGLIYVDFSTGQRIPKHSARWYSRLVRLQSTYPDKV